MAAQTVQPRQCKLKFSRQAFIPRLLENQITYAFQFRVRRLPPWAKMNSTRNRAICPHFMTEQRASCLWHKEDEVIWDPSAHRTPRLWVGTESRQASNATSDIVVCNKDSSWLVPHKYLTHPSPALRCLCLVGSSIPAFLLWGMPMSLSRIYNWHISSNPSPVM